MPDNVAGARDAEGTREGLAAWFSDRGVKDAVVRLLPGPSANGYSHESIVFELDGDGATRKLVARVEPKDVSVFPEPDLQWEYQLLESVADDDIPLPALHGFERSPEYLGAPFYVMDHVDGDVPGDSPPYPMDGWLLQASPDVRSHVWWSGITALTKPHLVRWDNRLEFVNKDRPLGIDGELVYWKDYIEFCGRPISDAAERAWEYLTSKKPHDTTVALCWGDSRLGNQLFSGGQCVGLLDWEMACLSDPIQDLAWYIHFDDLFTDGLGVARLEGIPSRDETIARYEDMTGNDAHNFDYFEVFAGFRFVVILQRLGKLQMGLGQLPPDSTFPVDNFASANLDKMLSEKGIP